MNIVVVDNDPNDLSQLTDALAALCPNSQIQAFTDPLLSAKYICNHFVDMVFLTDAMRPVNGFKLMRVLRKNIPKLEIVMLSSGEEGRRDAMQAGFDDYLIKPIAPDRLGRVVKQLAG